MSGVLTTNSNVTCGHQGAVAIASSAKLTVDGGAVLLKSGVANKSVSSACATQNDSNSGSKKCTSVTSVTSGEATKLTAGANSVLLDTLSGGTDGTVGGTPQTLLTATAGQNKLTAI